MKRRKKETKERKKGDVRGFLASRIAAAAAARASAFHRYA
jgi:hypothetical protein